MTTGTSVEKQTGRDVGRREPTRAAPRYRPAVDIVELADELRLLADMPGVRPQEIAINFERGVLTVHGKVEHRQSDDVKYVLHEYGVGDFYRVFEVGETIDAERISAEYTDGVLTLHLPKSEKLKSRKIEVRAP